MIKAPDVTLLYVVLAFLVAYAILKRHLFLPLAGILEARETEEATAARVHAESLEGLSRAVAHIEQELARTRREALKERETMRGDGRAHLEKKLAAARAAAAALLDLAASEIATETARSAAELPGRTETLARTLVEKVLGRRLAA
jgi:F0F1-type ATP synthase membrane subunit b/b'